MEVPSRPTSKARPPPQHSKLGSRDTGGSDSLKNNGKSVMEHGARQPEKPKIEDKTKKSVIPPPDSQEPHPEDQGLSIDEEPVNANDLLHWSKYEPMLNENNLEVLKPFMFPQANQPPLPPPSLTSYDSASAAYGQAVMLKSSGFLHPIPICMPETSPSDPEKLPNDIVPWHQYEPVMDNFNVDLFWKLNMYAAEPPPKKPPRSSSESSSMVTASSHFYQEKPVWKSSSHELYFSAREEPFNTVLLTSPDFANPLKICVPENSLKKTMLGLKNRKFPWQLEYRSDPTKSEPKVPKKEKPRRPKQVSSKVASQISRRKDDIPLKVLRDFDEHSQIHAREARYDEGPGPSHQEDVFVPLKKVSNHEHQMKDSNKPKTSERKLPNYKRPEHRTAKRLDKVKGFSSASTPQRNHPPYVKTRWAFSSLCLTLNSKVYLKFTAVWNTWAFQLASRHHMDDTVESERKLFCEEIDFASATHLESSTLQPKAYRWNDEKD